MSVLFFLFCGLSLLVALLAAPTLLRPGFTGLKLGALAMSVTLISLFHLSGVELLGRPKPARMELLDERKNDVALIASHMVEGDAIYLWLESKEDAEPRAYRLPWNRQSAEELHEATRMAESIGTRVRVRNPFRATTDDTTPNFYATPQQPPPPKTGAAETTLGATRSAEPGENS